MISSALITDSVQKARDLLKNSARVAAFSGAGLSAESGLATFRDPDPESLWSRFDPAELASVSGFETNPERVIDWYNWRRGILAKVAPNAAHRALATQSQMMQITQNVDHLLELAGVPASNVYHLHGSITRDRCHESDCDYYEDVDLAKPPMLRACPLCGGRMRPAVVWFGEDLPQSIWHSAQVLCTRLDSLLVVGTSARVYPAAGLITLAKQYQCRVIVIDPNPDSTRDIGDLNLKGSAGEILPELLDGLNLASR